MEIRRVVPGDADAVADVFIAALGEMTYLPVLHTKEEDRVWVKEVLLPNNEVWVAEKEGRVIAFAGLRDDLLGHLWVLPEEQNRGVGTALLALAKELRPSGLRLGVFQRNIGARRFYERHEFKLVELGDGSRNREGEPDALYEWLPRRSRAD